MRRNLSPLQMTTRLTFQRITKFSLLALNLFVLLLPGSGGVKSNPLLFKKTLRIMTYNIHVGVGMDKKLDLQRIADVINKEKPDLVGLQEVDRGVKRTEGKDEIAELAKMTRMDYAFAHNLDFQGGQYGVAILSRFLLRNVDHQMFANKREAERRGMLHVEVEVLLPELHGLILRKPWDAFLSLGKLAIGERCGLFLPLAGERSLA